MANPEDTLIIETSKGNVVVEMRPDLAPITSPVSRNSPGKASMTVFRFTG